MKLFRAFVFLASTALLGACGEGMPESSSHEDPQHQDPQQVIEAAQEQASQEPDFHVLVTSDYINPTETKTFATNWFSRTYVHVNNPNSVSVEARMWCSRYSTFRSMWVAPGTTWHTSVPCEGTTLYINNGASLGSGTALFVTVDN